jgi:hypothetical protein
MKVKRVKRSEVKVNPNNPRIIKDNKFKKLIKSVEDLPQMLEMRPIIVDEDMVILGGNMRYQACVRAGIVEVPIIQYTKAEHEKTGTKKTYEEVCQEIIIKDNVGFGEWDWDILGNEWDNVKLGEWGLDVWQPEQDVDYSILDELDLGGELHEKETGVKRAIQIEFDGEHYEEANNLINLARASGKNVGLIVLNALRNEA